MLNYPEFNENVNLFTRRKLAGGKLRESVFSFYRLLRGIYIFFVLSETTHNRVIDRNEIELLVWGRLRKKLGLF